MPGGGTDADTPAPSGAAAPPYPTQGLSILHFNDVYEVIERRTEPVGGAARFVHLVHRLRGAAAAAGDVSVLLFSGDALSPSLMSTITRGRHMTPVLNGAGVAAACAGNHDFDMGIPAFTSCREDSTFPWLLANCRQRVDGVPLGGCTEYCVVTAGEWRIGVIGLIEQEWLATLAVVDVASLEFEEPDAAAARLAPRLRGEEGCHLIVALTHMREPNDRLLAARAARHVDLILGGHDHDYMVRPPEAAGRPLVVKSGSDFRDLSVIRVAGPGAADGGTDALTPDGVLQGSFVSGRHHASATVWRYAVTSAEPADAAVETAVASYADVLNKKMDTVVGITRTPLDSRFGVVRTAESNIGSFICDLMRQSVEADVCILNSGTLRADAVLPEGVLRMRDIVALLPTQDPIVKLRMPGAVVLEALENSVCKWPALEGRFAQVSGLRFTFDPALPPGSRVVAGSVMVQRAAAATASAALPASVDAFHAAVPLESCVDDADGVAVAPPVAAAVDPAAGWEPLDVAATYTLATKAYLAAGKDGYDCFRGPRVETLVDEEAGPVLPAVIRGYFRMLFAMSGYKKGATVAGALSPFQAPRSRPTRAHLVRVPSTRYLLGRDGAAAAAAGGAGGGGSGSGVTSSAASGASSRESTPARAETSLARGRSDMPLSALRSRGYSDSDAEDVDGGSSSARRAAPGSAASAPRCVTPPASRLDKDPTSTAASMIAAAAMETPPPPPSMARAHSAPARTDIPVAINQISFAIAPRLDGRIRCLTPAVVPA